MGGGMEGGERAGPRGPVPRLSTLANDSQEAIAVKLREYKAVIGSPDCPLPDKTLPQGAARYFTLRALGAGDLKLSLKRGEWPILPELALKVIQAFQTGAAVFLFFSIIGSQHYQGVAQVHGMPVPLSTPAQREAMIGAAGLASLPPAPDAPAPLFSLPVQWLHTCGLPFAATAGLRNCLDPLLPTRPGSVVGGSAVAGRPAALPKKDATELDEDLGRVLMLLMYKQPAVAVDYSSLPDSAVFSVLDSFSGEGMLRLQEEGRNPGSAEMAAMVAAQNAAVDAALSGGPGGGRRDGAGAGGPLPGQLPAMLQLPDVGAALAAGAPLPASPAAAAVGGAEAAAELQALLSGKLPAGVPPGVDAATLAANAFVRGQPGWLFACNSQTELRVLQTGIFAAEDELAQAMLAAVHPGTPIILLNVHSRSVHGLFLARTRPVRDLVPGIFPPMGMIKKVFPWQVQCMRVCGPPPMPNEAFAPFIGQKPVPGVVPPAAIYHLSLNMLRRLPEAECCKLAGYLRLMESGGMPSDGLLETAIAATLGGAAAAGVGAGGPAVGGAGAGGPGLGFPPGPAAFSQGGPHQMQQQQMQQQPFGRGGGGGNGFGGPGRW